MASIPNDDELEKTYIYHQLDEYPWAEDAEFQGGLRAILGSVEDPARVEHLTLRAKCYYWARKAGTPVDFDGYKQWVEGLRKGVPTNGSTNASTAQLADMTPDDPLLNDAGSAGLGGPGDAPKPASFAEICELIAEGKPIPGIKDIPDTILEGQASESQAVTRKKPWEKGSDPTAAEKPSWMS